MALKDRIQEIIDSGITKKALAEAAGVSPSAVSQWLSGESQKLKGESVAGIQMKTGYSSSWLVSGRGPKTLKQGNTSEMEKRASVPLISWVKAGSWATVEDPFNVGEADEWIDAFQSKPGSNAFALRVDGDSMTNPHSGQRSFPDGTIIIVDPGMEAKAGDYVVAKDVATQSATFKRLAYDGGRWFLKPLNPVYPTIEIDDPAMRVIGRVIEFHIGGKL